MSVEMDLAYCYILQIHYIHSGVRKKKKKPQSSWDYLTREKTLR